MIFPTLLYNSRDLLITRVKDVCCKTLIDYYFYVRVFIFGEMFILFEMIQSFTSFPAVKTVIIVLILINVLMCVDV